METVVSMIHRCGLSMASFPDLMYGSYQGGIVCRMTVSVYYILCCTTRPTNHPVVIIPGWAVGAFEQE